MNVKNNKGEEDAEIEEGKKNRRNRIPRDEGRIRRAVEGAVMRGKKGERNILKKAEKKTKIERKRGEMMRGEDEVKVGKGGKGEVKGEEGEVGG